MYHLQHMPNNNLYNLYYLCLLNQANCLMKLLFNQTKYYKLFYYIYLRVNKLYLLANFLFMKVNILAYQVFKMLFDLIWVEHNIIYILMFLCILKWLYLLKLLNQQHLNIIVQYLYRTTQLNKLHMVKILYKMLHYKNKLNHLLIIHEQKKNLYIENL